MPLFRVLSAFPRARFVRRVSFVVFSVILALPAESQSLAETLPSESFDHAIVPGFERLYAAPNSDAAAGGQLLLGELNCASCHQPSRGREEQVFTKTAPVLDHVGSRVRLDYLRKFLTNPHETKPGTTMPNVFAGQGPQETAAQVEALVHFLATTGGLRDEQAPAGADRKGERLFHSVGCIACHAPRKAGASPVAVAVPLGDLNAKYSFAALAEFLEDPLKVRPGGRMPSLALKKNEAAELAAFFVRGGGLPPTATLGPRLTYSTYNGSWAKLPDFATLAPVRSGTVADFDLSVAQRKDNYAVRFTGFLHAPRAGRYTFHIGSDDGSRLVIDGQEVVACDGSHPFMWATAATELTAGPHSVAVEFFQAGGGDELQVEFEGPVLGRQELISHITVDRQPPKTAPHADGQSFEFDTALAAKGREIFARVGCANCHTLNEGKQLVRSTLEARPLAEIKSGSGCLQASPAAGRPHYALNDRQREALTAAVTAASQPNPPQPSPADAIHRGLATFNCYACHVRGGIGGVEEARNDYFETTQKEMGDEGRLPPTLDGVGDKLNLNYLRRIFAEGGEDRPYMVTHMPKFSLQRLPGIGSKLADNLAALDAKTAAPPVELAGPEWRIKAEARTLVGEQGLGCIKCHDFNKLSSTGIRAINMTKMTQRLRHDWFQRYLLDPQSLRPGTRMPAAWPNGGLVFFKKLLGGEANQQIEGIWVYLSAGTRAQTPPGITPKAMELVAETEPVMYRNFIEGAGPRAIGVGYPEKANLAWDADNMRLALIWHGAFIDASRHWTGRGEGFQAPAGDHVLSLTKLSPLATLADAEAAWPTNPAREQGYQFLGYRLEKDRKPTLRYRYQNVTVEETPAPIVVAGKPAEPGLKRTLVLTAPSASEQLWFLAAQGGSIEPQDGGRYLVDGEYTVKLTTDPAGPAPLVRKSNGKFELLVPVKFHDNRATIVADIEW